MCVAGGGRGAVCSSWEKGGVWFLSIVGAPKTYFGRGRFLVVSVFGMNGAATSTTSVATLANVCIVPDPS